MCSNYSSLIPLVIISDSLTLTTFILSWQLLNVEECFEVLVI